MLLGFAPFERGEVEQLRLPTLLTFNQCLTNALDLKSALLLTADEVADRLAVVGLAACVDLGGNP